MSDREPVRLRPHHGLCLRFFEGYGYSDAFSANMAAVLAGLEDSSPVEAAQGPDCICENCPNLESGCPDAALYDRRVSRLCGLKDGEQLTWGQLQKRIGEAVIRPGKLSFVCGDCQWAGICGKKNE